MSEREQDTENADHSDESEEDTDLLESKEHSDAPGPFGTGEEQTENEAAGNPGVEDDA